MFQTAMIYRTFFYTTAFPQNICDANIDNARRSGSALKREMYK
jgi:hypothetical protein